MSTETSTSEEPRRPLGKREVILREHVYDGIQEYDQRLPNWWLFTLYGRIIFSFVFYFYYISADVGGDDISRVNSAMLDVEATRLANSIDVTNDDLFWQMAENPQFITAGKATYESTCAQCHMADLTGDIGLNLIDAEWKHGARPSQIYATIANGVITAGMPAHENLIGQKRVVEVTAYVLSKNDRATLEAAINGAVE